MGHCIIEKWTVFSVIEMHFLLIELAKLLGYKQIPNGLCKGFNNMWIQAVCCGDKERQQFLARLNFLYQQDTEILLNEIGKTKDFLKKQENMPKEQQKILTEPQRKLIDIVAFFEGIAATYMGCNEWYSISGNRTLSFQDEVFMVMQSQKLEELGGVKRAFRTSDQYNKSSLKNHLDSLNKRLINEQDVAIEFSANNHALGVRVVGEDQFELIDINNLNLSTQVYNSIELAQKLNECFFNTSIFDYFVEPNPLVLSTSVFTTTKRNLDLEDLKNKKPLTRLVNNKDDLNLFFYAIIRDDVDILKRIDFNLIDVNQNVSSMDQTIHLQALTLAALNGSKNSVDYLLKIPSINVSPEQLNTLYPLSAAIQGKHYDIAEKIAEHQTSKLNHKSAQDNGLHYITVVKEPNDQTFLFAEQLIKKGVDINQKNARGNTPLYEACRNGDNSIVSFFIKNDAQLHVLNADNQSILHAAIYSDNKELIQSLISANLDCNLRDINGLRPLDLAFKLHKFNYLPMLLAKTKLTRKDLCSSNELCQLVSYLGPIIQSAFLKSALNGYIEERNALPDYLNWIDLGIKKDEKIAAAKALLAAMGGDEDELDSYQNALNNGVLSSLYQVYKQYKICNQSKIYKDRMQDLVNPNTKEENLDAVFNI